jgi:hypothetical protein
MGCDSKVDNNNIGGGGGDGFSVSRVKGNLLQAVCNTLPALLQGSRCPRKSFLSFQDGTVTFFLNVAKIPSFAAYIYLQVKKSS